MAWRMLFESPMSSIGTDPRAVRAGLLLLVMTLALLALELCGIRHSVANLF